MRRAPIRFIAPLVLGALLATLPAYAQSNVADAHLQRGLELREQGNDEQALIEFQQAFAASNSARAQAQMAMAEQALGRWLDAEGHMRAALATSSDRWIARNRAGLQAAYQTIASHVGMLEVRGSVAGAEVRVDGRPVGTLPLTAPVRVVAGTVTLRVTAPGHLPVERSVPVQGGGLARETIDLVPAPANTTAPTQTAAAPTETVPAASAPAAPPQSYLTTAADVSGAIGALALIGGAVAHVQRETRIGIYNSRSCIADGDTRLRNCGHILNDARTAETLAITGYAFSGAFLILAVVLYVIAPDEPARASHARIRCGQGPGELGIACTASF